MPISANSSLLGDTRASSNFWDRVRPLPTGCWEWTGQITEEGYGHYGTAPRSDGRSHIAHRYAYQALVGPIGKAMQIDHTCHDPAECAGGDGCSHRRCVNPEHLKQATPRENSLRSNGPAAANALKTHCPQNHPLSGENLAHEGRKRRCRTCRRDQLHRVRQRQRSAL